MSNTFSLSSFASLRTPFYHYDLPLLRRTLDAIRAAVADHNNFQVHYAVKANANPVILQTIARQGFGADCVSGGEIEAALYAGFPAKKIVFAGVGKADWEIELALRAGIACFNVESLPELEVINDMALAMGRVANVAFRVNPNVDAHTHAKITTGLNENKFGIAMDDLLPAIRRTAEMKGVRYVGMHFHIGSQILELDVFDHLSERINELQARLEADGIHTSSINVGGGLGIDYADPDAHPIPAFADYFRRFATHLRLRPGQQLHFELGRSVVAQCGTLVARTLYVKHGHTKDFLIVDAGFTELIRPAMYGSSHAIQNLSAAPGSTSSVYDVVGPICESSDVFGKDVTLATAGRGDLIAFRSAGAYGEVMASTYNCRRL
ncbi:MAG: diaminopimelate decarboxylase, partial [Alloprevotella sp.]